MNARPTGGPTTLRYFTKGSPTRVLPGNSTIVFDFCARRERFYAVDIPLVVHGTGFEMDHAVSSEELDADQELAV